MGADRLSRVVALVALALYAAHALTGAGGPGLDRVFDDGVYSGLILLAAGVCARRAHRDARERSAWGLLAGALALWFAGETISSLRGEPGPVSDLCLLAFYPGGLGALVLLARQRLSGTDRLLWLDAGVGALAVCAAVTAWLWAPVTQALGQEPTLALTNLAYPVGDLCLLGFVIAVIGLTGWRPGRAWLLLAAGFVLAAAGDLGYLARAAGGEGAGGAALALVWPVGALGLAEAARQPARPVSAAPPLGARVLVVPALCALVALALVLYGNVAELNGLALALAGATLLGALARMVLTFAENLRMVDESRREALTDALTGLGNRRRLFVDLRARLAPGPSAVPHVLLLFDLDGFKQYNDTLGHPAGDALLARLGLRLEETVGARGRAYRLGGDEFCALVRADGPDAAAVIGATADALAEEREGVVVRSSQGLALLPQEAASPSAALKLADRRLYEQKHGRRRRAAGQETAAALLQLLRAREPAGAHREGDVAELAAALGRRVGLRGEALADLARAAELQDVGTSALPDAVLRKAGPLDEGEWRLIHQHTIVGEQILSAAPALAGVGRLVRASHERFDGSGYPDGLSGEAIPLGARVLAVCTAWEAMTAERPYRAALGPEEAMAELQAGAGSQFDPRVIAALRDELAPPAGPAARARATAVAR